jgi:hypothetical protein
MNQKNWWSRDEFKLDIITDAADVFLCAWYLPKSQLTRAGKHW